MNTDEEVPVQSGDSVPVPSTGIHTDPVGEFRCAECGGTVNVAGLEPFSDVTCPGCGTHAPVPARLNNFLLLRLMGTGGMGGVYYARDEVLGRYVAIKVMLESLGDDPVFIETFQREAQAVAKLNHPNIAQIYSFGREKGQPYIVMELVSGERVDAMMETPQGISPALAIRIGLEIAQGLCAADEAGLVHGDIKPENILLDNKGQAKLVDFGLATVAHQAAGEGIWGTPYYIAPEKIRRQKVDARSDIYSLGATLFHMLTGKPPFEGETPLEVVKARLDRPPPDPRDLKPELPEIVSSTIKRMLAVDRAERYPNYLSLISDLRKVAQDLGRSETAIPSVISSGKKIRFKKKKNGMVSAALPSTSAPAAVSTPTSKSKRLVIHKESQRVSTFRTTGSTVADGVEPVESVAPVVELTPEEIRAKKARASRRRKKIFATLIILFLLLSLGAVGVVIYLKRLESFAQRADLVAIGNARNAANTSCLAISNEVERMAVLAALVEPLEAKVQNAVERITGKKIELTPPPAEVPPPPVEATPAAEAAPVTNAEPAVAATNDPAPAAETEPAGVVDAEAEVVPDVAVPVEPDVPPEPEVPDDPVIAPARLALENIQMVLTLNREAKEEFETATSIRDRVLKINLPREAANDAKELDNLKEQAEERAAQSKRAFDVVQSKSSQVQDFLNRFEQKLKATQAAELEGQRRREEAERVERERQEYSARVTAEQEQAQNARAEVKNMFDVNNFEGALAELKTRVQNYTTKEGKAAIQVQIDRYTYLTEMKAGLISGIQEKPYSWGWGYGPLARDIEKADGKGIYVKGAPPFYSWAEVPTTQMLKLVDYYMEVRTTRPRTRINLAFGAAVYCDEFGPAGRDRAKTYANRAMDMGATKEAFTRLLEAGWH